MFGQDTCYEFIQYNDSELRKMLDKQFILVKNDILTLHSVIQKDRHF